MANNLIDLQAHRKKMEEDSGRVPCAHCGKLIPMHASRCPFCGVHFKGFAFQFEYHRRKTHKTRIRSPLWIGMVIVAVATLVAAGLLWFRLRT